jgi:DNA repair protein SbcC/Rad50
LKLLRLKMEEFGPYQGSEMIDFRALRFSRLFLIHGPVGSGKTFILDGICFALYGRSSAGERDRSGLRNLNAPPDRETVSALDFQCGSQSFRVERRMSLVDSDDGSQDEVTLWRLPELGNPTRRDILSAKASGVSSMIHKLLGLSAEQFCQVGILPQGHFRRFLLANGDKRRDILSNMFGTGRHARFQENLQKSFRELKGQLEQAWAERESLVESYRDVGGDPRQCLQRSQEELERVQGECLLHQEKSTEWERSLEEAVRFEILDRQRDMSERELVALKVGGSPEDALTDRLRVCLPEYDKWRGLVSEAEVISAELHQQRAQYERLKSDTNFLEAEVERARKLEEERFSLRRSIERLEIVLDDCRGIEVLTTEMSRVQQRMNGLAERRIELAGGVKKTKARIQQIHSELETIEAAAARLEGLKSELEHISELQGKARQTNLLEDAYEQAQQRETRFEEMVSDLLDKRKKLEKELSKQKERDLADALHALRSALKEGDECPLCGSIEHPNPYSGRRRRRPNQGEDDEALKAMTQRLELAENELAQAKERKARLQGRMEERQEAPVEMVNLDETTIQKLRQTVIAVEQRASAKEDLKKELRQLQEAYKPARSKLKKMRLLKERLASTVSNIEAQIVVRRKGLITTATTLLSLTGGVSLERLPDLIEEESVNLKMRLEELANVTYTTERAELMAETFALQLAESRASEKRRDSLHSEATEIQETLMDRFRKDFAGWDDLSFAFGRLAREANFQSGEGAVVDRETLIRTVEHQLHQSQELLETLPTPEMKAEQIRQALARERDQLEFNIGRRATLEKSLERSSEDVEQYDGLVERIRGLEHHCTEVERLASLAQGSKGLSFHDWYLDRVFRKVIDAANLRLEVLAPNRFCLGLQEGLEVRIVDFMAGKERAATTLSGGESFLASLALALALGDVLQSDRDSRDRLQTLFIDEGFGYLDRRALEASLDCLESLKQEGRIVGIISHVSALRERIRAQVVVAANDSPLPYGTERVQVFAE